MLCQEGFLFLFMWLVTITYCDKSIINKVKVNDKVIEIYDLKYNILSNPDGQDRTREMDKVNALFLVSSCSAAEWTIFYLCDFVLKFPLFYSRKFFNTNYKNLFIKNHDLFVKMLTHIVTNISNFIKLLGYLMKKTPYSLHYKDNSIFTTLVLLQIKIEIIILTKQDNPESNDSDVIVIREMLEEMNAVQIFLSLNCNNTKPGEAKYASQMYGYTIIEPVKTFKLMDKFRSYVKHNSSCDFPQTFLQRFVGKLPEDPPFAHDIGNSESNIYNERGMVVQIKDVSKQIQSSYNINVIFLYMKCILGAIIKLLYNTIMEGMQKMYLTYEITYMIDSIFTEMIDSRDDYPSELLQEFLHLTKAKNRYNFTENENYLFRMSVLCKQYEKYSYIKLGKYQLTMDDVLDESKKQGDYNIIEMEKIEFQNYLNIFLKTIKENLNEFICFNKYFQYFKNEFNKTYLPNNIFEPPNKTINPLNKIKNDKKNKSNNDVGIYNKCYFIIDMYYMCYSSVMFLNKSVDPKNTKSKLKIKSPDNNLIKAKAIIYDIRNYFINFIRIEGNNLELCQIGIDIVTVLANLPEFDENSPSLHVKYLKRIINYIMAKLNSWGLVYCPYPKFSFLLFNYAHLNKFMEKDTDKMYEEQEKYKNTINSQIEPQDYQCFHFKYLYNTFITNETQSKTLQKYEHFIKFQWKGKDLTIQQVYADFKYLIFNSHFLYVFYDTYFMYHIAALYYEMKKILQPCLSGNTQDCILVQPESTKKKKYDILERTIDYPRYLGSLVSRIISLEKDMYKYANNEIDNNEFEAILEQIKTMFTNSNIIFMNDKKSKKLEIRTTDLAGYKLLTDEIIKDMSTLFNICYLKTQKLYIRNVAYSDTVQEFVYPADDDDDNDNDEMHDDNDEMHDDNDEMHDDNDEMHDDDNDEIYGDDNDEIRDYDNDEMYDDTIVNTELPEEKAREETSKSKTSELPKNTEKSESTKLPENTKSESSEFPKTSEPEEYLPDKHTVVVPTNFEEDGRSV